MQVDVGTDHLREIISLGGLDRERFALRVEGGEIQQLIVAEAVRLGFFQGYMDDGRSGVRRHRRRLRRRIGDCQGRELGGCEGGQQKRVSIPVSHRCVSLRKTGPDFRASSQRRSRAGYSFGCGKWFVSSYCIGWAADLL